MDSHRFARQEIFSILGKKLSSSLNKLDTNKTNNTFPFGASKSKTINKEKKLTI